MEGLVFKEIEEVKRLAEPEILPPLVILFPPGKKPAIHVTFHKNEIDPPVKVFEVSSFKQASDLAEGVLDVIDDVYCVRIWEGGIPCESVYRAGGRIFRYNVLGILSPERAAEVALED
ncbi:MAG: hypothetical protein Q8O91_05665 [Candidatus Aminicenantes bacterium]|nr:hypothetical protein [Candidatus Aminicenantes bacterium]